MSPRLPYLRLMRIISLLVLIALIAGLAAQPRPVYSQNEELIPPRIIDLWPVNGAELAPGEPITITFDQPMNQASVEKAITITPEIKGKFAWPDAQTVTFTPLDRWPRGTALKLLIGTGASAANNQPLEREAAYTIKTMPGLQVANITPLDKLDYADSTSKITVAFDRGVVPLTTSEQTQDFPAPITISPAIKGTGRWVNTALYVFTPADPLPGGTSYTITVPAGLTAADSTTLEAPVTSTFRVQMPQVKKIRIQDTELPCRQDKVGLDCPIVVEFSEAMDHASTEAAFALYSMPDGKERKTVGGTFKWATDDKSFVFTPNARLDYDTFYYAAVAKSARSKSLSSALVKDESVGFRTALKPGVAGTSHENGKVHDVGNTFSFRFNSYMKFSTIKSRIQVSPQPETLRIQKSYYENDDQTDITSEVVLYFEQQPEKQYTVTLKAGAEDIYGSTIDQDTVITFTTQKPEIKTIAYPVLNGTFMTTGAYDDKTHIDLMVQGKPTVKFAVYPLTTEPFNVRVRLSNFQFGDYCQGGDGSMGFGRDLGIDVSNRKPFRAWEQTFEETGTKPIRREVPLASEQGGKIPPGLYLVTVTSERSSERNQSRSLDQFVLAASTANITVKRNLDELLVWVTDIAKATPLAGVPVTAYYKGKPLSLGKTDANGIARSNIDVPRPGSDDYFIDNEAQLYIVAQSKDVYGAWYSCNANKRRPPMKTAYLYTDCPIYRPGETVYVKGILRDQWDTTYTPSTKQTAHIRLSVGGYYYNDNKPIFEADLPVNASGSFSGEIKLPDDVQIDNAFIYLGTDEEIEAESRYYGYYYDLYYRAGPARVSFTIAAFRPPEFEVKAAAVQTEIIQGDPLNADVTTAYYSGGGVGHATIKWATYGAPAYFDFRGKGNYYFYDERWPYFYNSRQDSGQINTGDDGKQRITSKATVLNLKGIGLISDGLGPGAYRADTGSDPAPGTPPIVLITEATVTDEANQPVSGRTAGTLTHPANVYVGIDAQTWGAASGKPTPIRLITVRPDSTPVANQPVQITISKITWKYGGTNQYDNPQWYQDITAVRSAALKTAADGTLSYDFTPPAPGVYRVAVQTADEKGRINSATLRLYISGHAEAQWNDPLLTMTPVADKQSYKPGDTAVINAPLGFAGRSLVLVTVERNSVLTSEVVEVNGPILTYKLPITDQYAPGVFVYFTAYRGLDSDHPQPDYRYGQVQIAVEPVSRRLKVSLKPSTTTATPAGKVTFDILVTDYQDKPVNAEVGLALVDKSVLALVKPNTPTLEEAFYGGVKYNYVQTNLSMFGYMPILSNSYIVPCCFGGGGGGPFQLGDQAVNVRSNFKFTAFWSPFVVTDQNGKAQVTVTLPDNATTWHMDARAVTTTTLVGQGETELIATLPLLMRPVAPRFFVAGDKVQLAAVINNNTGRDQTAKVTLKATGVTLSDPETQTVTIAGGRRARVTWNVSVPTGNVDNADLTFIVIGEDGYSDAAKPNITTGPNGTIPIYQFVAYDNVATAGSLFKPGTRTEGISLIPGLNTGQGQVVFRVDSSLAAASIDSLNYLQAFPHDCVEQTTSKFLPNIFTLRALKKLNISNPKLEAALDDAIRKGIDKLEKSRNRDNGWGWFIGQQSDPLVTAYVLLALLEAESEGYTRIFSGVAIEPVAKGLITPNAGSESWELNRQAFYQYVMARFWQKHQDYKDKQTAGKIPNLRSVFDYRTKLNYAGRAFLLMAYYLTDPKSPEIATLTADLESAAVVSATSAHWEEAEVDWWNWGSNVRTTALVIDALIHTKPDSPLLPQAVRWLMNARTYDHWETTQETTWSVIALTDWMLQTGELRGNYTYDVKLNGESILKGTVTPADVRSPSLLQVDIKKLLVDQANRLVVSRSEGDGALYYTANLKLYGPASEAKAINRGVSIKREYFVGDKSRTPITSVQVGDLITVRLTFSVTQDMRYFVLEDPIPAGTEAVDTSLQTSSMEATGPDLNRVPDGDYYWYWGWWYIDRTEVRDQQVNLYATRLPRGTYTFTYQVRATMAGQFQTMAAHAYPFYYPDLFGRSEGVLFTIKPEATTS